MERRAPEPSLDANPSMKALDRKHKAGPPKVDSLVEGLRQQMDRVGLDPPELSDEQRSAGKKIEEVVKRERCCTVCGRAHGVGVTVSGGFGRAALDAANSAGGVAPRVPVLPNQLPDPIAVKLAEVCGAKPPTRRAT